MQIKTIEQLVNMPGAELRKYLISLPVEERKLIDKDLYKAIRENTIKQMVNNLNNNMTDDNETSP